MPNASPRSITPSNHNLQGGDTYYNLTAIYFSHFARSSHGNLRQAKVYRPQFQVPCAWIDSRKRVRFTPDANLIMQSTSEYPIALKRPWRSQTSSENHSYINLPPSQCLLSIHQQDHLISTVFSFSSSFVSRLSFHSWAGPFILLLLCEKHYNDHFPSHFIASIFTPSNSIPSYSIASQS
jgi:hypothetical protein